MLRRFALGLAVAIASTGGGTCRHAVAQHITIDGSLSPTHTATTLIGPNYTIGADLGRQIGGNLFHSFGIFGLASGEGATFTGPASVGNIIGRVTGGTLSSIDGRIDTSAIPGANLFLINPAGIVFGPRATVAVSGSFYASSAGYVRMADGARFQATNPAGSTFSAAPPAAFGFLTANPGAITVNGTCVGSASCPGPPPAGLALVGGPVTIENGAMLAAPAGTIRIASAAGPGEIPVDPGDVAAATVANFGPVAITGGSKLAVSDPNRQASGGSVLIRAGTLTIADSEIDADNYGPAAGGALVLQADSAIALSGTATNIHAIAQGAGRGPDVSVSTGPSGSVSLDSRSEIEVGATAAGSAGNLSVTTGQLHLAGGGNIFSSTSGMGRGGDVSVAVGGALTIDGSESQILSGTGGTARAGDVAVGAGGITLTSGGEILSRTNGSGPTGTVAVTVTGGLVIDGGGLMGNPTGVITQSFMAASGPAGAVSVDAATVSIAGGGEVGSLASGSGPAGNVSVGVSGLLSIDGRAFAGLTGITSQGPGAAGTVTVTAAGLSILGGGEITTSTFGPGNAGRVLVTVAGPVSIDGTGASPNLLTGIDSDAEAGSSGDAGPVTIAAGSLSIFGGGEISSSVLRSATGNAGSVAVQVAGPLSIDGAGAMAGTTGITSSTGAGTPGRGGDVTVSAATLTLADGGGISGNTMGRGDAGTVTVAAGDLSIAGPAQISSGTFATGNGGSVVVDVANTATLTGPGPQITALSRGSGNAGSVSLRAGVFEISSGAAVSTAGVAANGGNIDMSAADVRLQAGAITTSVITAAGNGGNIAIDASRLVLDSGAVTATADKGHGGDILIQTGEYLASADSTVSATSRLGISGTIEIIGPRVDLNGSLVVLPGTLRAPAAVLRSSCAARAPLPRSSLVEAPNRLPQDPDTTLRSFYLGGADRGPAEGIGLTAAPGDEQPDVARLAMLCW